MSIKKKIVKNKTTGEQKKTIKTKDNVKTKKSDFEKAMPKPKKVDGCFVSVPKINLKKAIDLVSNALSSKEYNDAKSGIMLETKYVNDEPMLFLTANSLSVFVKYGIQLQDDVEESCVVPNGNAFRRIVYGLQGLSSPIDLSFGNEDDIFEITCGEDYESMVQHYPVEGFILPPTEDEITENEEVVMPVKFVMEALDKVAFACSKDVTIPELTGVLIEQTKDSINIVGGDGNRLSYLKMNSKTKNPKSVIVGVKPLQMLNSILKTLDVKDSEIIKLYLSDDKIYFIHENTTIGIQIFAGEYPIDGGYEQFVFEPADCEITFTLEFEKFLERLDLATLHNSSTLEPIMMILDSSSKKIKCKFVNTDISENKFNVEFDISDFKNESGQKDLQFTVTPTYLYDVLKALGSKKVTMGVCSLDGPAIIRPIGLNGIDYCHTFNLN